MTEEMVSGHGRQRPEYLKPQRLIRSQRGFCCPNRPR